jgi:cytidyltransferase-like protein
MDFDTLIAETIARVLEGGDSFGTGVVDRINKEDIKPTIEALQSTLLDKIGVDVTSTRVLGSAGMKVSSGDLDVGIAGDLELEQIYAAVQKAGIQCKMNRGLSQVSIVFPQHTAQGPNGKNVQVDLVKGDLDYLAWSHSSSPENKGGVMIRAMMAGVIKVITNQGVNNMRGVFSRTHPAKYKKVDADYSRDLNKLVQQISAKSKEPWTIEDTTKTAGEIWEKVKRSFTPEECSAVAVYFKEFMTAQKIPIPQWLGEAKAPGQGKVAMNLSGQTTGGSAQGVGGGRNRGKVPKGMVPDTLRNNAPATGNEDEGFKTQDPADIYEANDKAAQLASEYVRIHNAASKEFTKAFNAIGARMWNADHAHPLKQKNVDFIANQMRSRGIDGVRELYRNSCVPFPLTVMDAYPEAHKHKASLEKVLDAIKKKYDAEWFGIIDSMSNLNEAVDPKDMQKSIPHIDDLRPEQFMQFLKKYKDEPVRLEISEKVDGSARVSFGVGAGHIWTQGKHGSRKASSNQYQDNQMFKALKMCHKALESKAQVIIAQWPEGVEFMVAEVLYTRVPNSIEYGPNVLMIHGVESAQGSLDDREAKIAAGAVIGAAGGELTDGSEQWKLEYKREISPQDVLVDVTKEYETLGQLHQELLKKPRDRNMNAEFKKIQKQVKDKLITMLRAQKSVYGPEGGDVEGIVFRDLDSGLMVKLVDKDFFTKLNGFLWQYRQMIDQGVMSGGVRKTGVMQGFRKVVADEVLGDPSAASRMLVKNLTAIGQSVQGKTPDQRADKTLAKYIKDNNLMSGDFARDFQRSLMGAFQDFGRLKQDWEQFKSKPQSIDIDGKKREFSKEIIQRTDEAFNDADAALQGVKSGMQVAHGIKDPLTQKVALMKLFMGHKFQKLVDALSGGNDEVVEEGIGSWARGIAAGAMLGMAGQSASDNTAPPPPDEISRHEETIGSMVKTAAQETGVPEELIAAIMSVESGGRPNAKSKKGACGLMQLMPKTAASMGVTDIMDPQQNLLGGARYLKKLSKAFRGNLDHVIAAYNMGPTALHRAEDGKRPKETVNYVKKVKHLLGDKSIKLQTEGLWTDMIDNNDEKYKCRFLLAKYEPLLVKNGIKITKFLGSGYYGSAYDIGAGKVLKITDDADEARSSAHLLGKKSKTIVEFYNVFRFPQENQDDQQFFGIVMEKVETLKPGSHQESILTSAVREFQDVVDNSSWIDKNLSWDDITSYYETMMQNDPDNDIDSTGVLQTLELFNIGEIRDELLANDILFNDLHGGNLGYAKNGKWKAFDLGAESASPGDLDRVPVLEAGGPTNRSASPTALDGQRINEPGLDDGEKANTVESMIHEQLRVLLEAQQGTIGATIGRFQPFHAGHAAIIRQLAQKYSSVVIFVAGQKLEAKNPFSHETRLKMMEASLPDVWSKIKVFPATIQGKGTGYIPGLIANAAASGMAEIQMDGSVDVLVGQDRVKDQETQAKHNEAHKGEKGYYPGIITVAALPDVKNDDDAGRISGTRLREAITNGDEQSVKKMLDPHLADGPEFANIYKELKDQMARFSGITKEIVETVINELGSGAQDGGAARQGGASGWSRAILARDMTGEEIYQQMNKSPSTRMLQMANHGTPNDHLPGQDALDQSYEDEQDAKKPTDLGEFLVREIMRLVERDDDVKDPFPRVQPRSVPVIKDYRWNQWTLDKKLAPYKSEKDGVGPGEKWLTLEPKAPTFGGAIQGGGTKFDIKNGDKQFEVKAIEDRGVINISKKSRGFMESFIGEGEKLKQEIRKFMNLVRVASEPIQSHIAKVINHGFRFEELKEYLDIIEEGGRFVDFTLGHRQALIQILENCAEFNQYLPTSLRFEHPWIVDKNRFEIDTSTLDYEHFFSKAKDGIILCDEVQGWFLIPISEAIEWFEFYGLTRGDLQLRLKKMPYGTRAEDRENKLAQKTTNDIAKRTELNKYNNWCVLNKLPVVKDLDNRAMKTSKYKKFLAAMAAMAAEDEPRADPLANKTHDAPSQLALPIKNKPYQMKLGNTG